MKILFFITSLPEDELPKRQFPLGVGYVAAYLEQHLSDIQVILSADPGDIFTEKPDLLGISSVSQCFPQALTVAEAVKRELQIPIILGGYHISTLPHRLPTDVDVGVIGEGERPMLALVKHLQQKQSFDSEALGAIGGICFRDRRGKIVITEPTEPIHLIDTLPFPKRNIRRGAQNIYLFTSRGCINRCKFCASTRHWRKFRRHSASYIIRELKYLIRTYEATSIFLLDDLFFADKKRIFELARLMESENLVGRLKFHGFISSNLATRELLETARHLGFQSIRFGAETGSDRLLKQMKGKWASVAHHQRCIDLCQQLGLEVRASFMFGAPGETAADLELTYQFLKRNAGVLHIDGFYLTTAIPGTPYWRLAFKKGLVSDDMDWSRLNLDIMKEQSFNFHKAIYLNEENMPISNLINHIRRFQDEFLFRN